MHKSKNKGAIIFDFDGVLADTQHLAFKIIERLANSRKVSKPSNEFIRTNEPRVIMQSLKIKWWELPYIAYITRKWGAEISPEITLFPWSHTLLNTAESLFDNVWIVSSNDQERIIRAFSIAGINFDRKRIVANIGFLTKSKYLKKIVNKQNLNPSYVIYVGDESRDITAAHKAGIKCLSVGWGFQDAKFLNDLNPGYVLEDPALFESTIKSIIISE